MEQTVKEALETIGNLSPEDLEAYPPTLVHRVKRLFVNVPLQCSSVDLVESLTRRRMRISKFLGTDVATAVRSGLLFSSADPCIDDIARMSTNSQHDAFRYVLALRSMSQDYKRWESENCISFVAAKKSTDLKKSATVKKYAEFKGIEKLSIVQHVVTHGKKLERIIEEFGGCGIAFLLSFENSKWRALKKNKVTDFVKLCQKSNELCDFAQKGRKFFEDSQAEYDAFLRERRRSVDPTAVVQPINFDQPDRSNYAVSTPEQLALDSNGTQPFPDLETETCAISSSFGGTTTEDMCSYFHPVNFAGHINDIPFDFNPFQYAGHLPNAA